MTIALELSYENDGEKADKLKWSSIKLEILPWSSEVKLSKLLTLIFEVSGTLSSKVPSLANSFAVDSTKALTADFRLVFESLSAVVAEIYVVR